MLLSRCRLLLLFVLCLGRLQYFSQAATVSTDVDDVIMQVLEMIYFWRSNAQKHGATQQQQQQQQRPFVTITFAQSLDGKIAPYCNASTTLTKPNYPISQKESLRLTHALRSTHDGILVGSKTLLLDNPRLTNRLWGTKVQQQNELHQPRPIVLDTNLLATRKLLNTCRAKNLIVCCSEEAASSILDDEIPHDMQILPCRCNKDGMLDLADVLAKLRSQYSIKSLMVEGGAAVLSSFFQDRLVDCICVTFARKIVGPGIGPTYTDTFDLSNADANFMLLGDDCCLLSKWATL